MELDEQDATAQQDQKIPVKIKSERMYIYTQTLNLGACTFHNKKSCLSFAYYKFKDNLQAKDSISLVLLCLILVAPPELRQNDLAQERPRPSLAFCLLKNFNMGESGLLFTCQ